MSEIGGSMGPLYGMMFSDMAEQLEIPQRWTPPPSAQ
ncbi:MAG: hypothetical protein R3D80_21255 [Paracoccaceae bacterium]